MKILVTGGNGMIGRRTINQLSAKDSTIVSVDNNYVEMPPVRDVATNYFVDIRNDNKLDDIFRLEQPEVVVHLAAVHHIPTCEQQRAFSLDVNIVGTEKVIEKCEQYGVNKLIIASSGAVYDWSETALSEANCTVKANDNYSLAKLVNEKQLELYHKRTGATAVIARIFNSLGFDDPNSHLIPDILKQIDFGIAEQTILLGNTRPRRDYISADDVASALVAIIKSESGDKSLDIVNICNNVEYSVTDIVQIISNILGIKINVETDPAKIRKIDRISQLGNNGKLKSKYFWSKAVSVEDCVAEMITYYKVK